MPLDKNALKNGLETAFDTAKAEGWTTEEVAAALADAIHAYVRSGDVTEVRVSVSGSTGTQVGTGKIR